MNYIIDFYKGLDTFNLILFWGVIIVILLLLIFSIIIVNKNRKLERIIKSNGIDLDDEYDNDLAIKKITEEPREEKSSIEIKETKTIVEETKEAPKETTAYTDDNHVDYNVPVHKAIEEEVPKEKKFVAEEHVQAYSDDFFDIPIKRNPVEEEVKKEPIVEKETIIKETITQIPRNNEPYQRNILREVYPSQTSPIGVARTTKVENKEVTGARELNEALTMNNVISENNINAEMPKREIPREETVVREPIREPERKPVFAENQRRGNYLEELSKKMAQNNSGNDIRRTEYELEQEENAIISYEELLRKKDTLKTIDEEDAVISIEELRKRKEREEKLYNITNDEPTDDFINELKNFRSDL